MFFRMAVVLVSIAALAAAQEWRHYGGDAGGTRYSPLDQINKSNVRKLRPAWVFDTGDWSDGKTYPSRSAFETTPIVVDGVMFVSSSFHRLFALDAENGKVLWEFDPQFDRYSRVTLHFSRGVTYWSDGTRKRIFLGDQEGRLFSVDAVTGKADPSFGVKGMLDLRKGVADRFPNSSYGLTSPVTACGNTIVTGAWVGDGDPQGPAGDIRGFDARTGSLKWTFHVVPRPGEFGHDTWEGDSWKDRAGVNSWTVFSADPKRRLVYVPLTSPATDFYGGDRKGANLFGDSLVALDCETGKRRWHFQTVHHNVWDYDLPAQPVLMTLQRDGKPVDAVAQITKMGFVFVFDRETGKPLFDIEERPIPKSETPGEATWPTQPFPVRPPPFARQSMRLDEMTTVTPESAKECREMIRDAVVEGQLYRPITQKMTVMFPGTNGGANWGSGSWDASTGTLYVNSMDVASFTRMVPRPGSTVPWRNQSYGRFWDSNMYPCQQPPWGSLTAIDMNKGEIRWQARLGEFDELTARGIPKTGAPNLGGSIVTKGGLVFIAATNDGKFRAFDKDTGEELWMTRLPASGHATPMTWRGPKSGRQFVAIAAGGGNKYNSTFSGKMVVYALPRNGDPADAPVISVVRKPSLRANYRGAQEKLPERVAAQPVPFSHAAHKQTACAQCHPGGQTSARAGIPTAADCVTCHTSVKPDAAGVKAARHFATTGQPIPWVRVYQVRDFVNFSHAKHAKASCSTCHGEVQQHDVLSKERSTSMTACMSCHARERAPVNCSICHDLGQ